MKALLPGLALLLAVATTLALLRPAFRIAPHLVPAQEIAVIPAAADLRPRRPVEGETVRTLAAAPVAPPRQYTVAAGLSLHHEGALGILVVGTGGGLRVFVNGVELSTEDAIDAGGLAAKIPKELLNESDNRVDAIMVAPSFRPSPRAIWLGPHEPLKSAAGRLAALDRLGAVVIALSGSAAALLGFLAAFTSREGRFLVLPSLIVLIVAGGAALDRFWPDDGGIFAFIRPTLVVAPAVLLLLIVAGENDAWPPPARLVLRSGLLGLLVFGAAAAAEPWAPEIAPVVSHWAALVTVALSAGAALFLVLIDKAMRSRWSPAQRAASALLALALLAAAVAETAPLGAYGFLIGHALWLVAAAGALTIWFVLVASRIFIDFEAGLRKRLGLGRIVREQKERLAAQQKALEEEISRRAVLEERERFSKDIHDGLGGSLVGLLMRSRTGELDSEELEAGLSHALQDLRLMVDALDHEQESAPAAFATFQTRIAPAFEAAGITLDWRQDDLSAFSFKNSSDMLHVLRILQEACTNVIRHSGASAATVRIGVQRENGGLEVEIIDDGRATASSGSGGMGLKNMGQRAASIGGILTARARDEGGWRVRLDLPGL